MTVPCTLQNPHTFLSQIFLQTFCSVVKVRDFLVSFPEFFEELMQRHIDACTVNWVNKIFYAKLNRLKCLEFKIVLFISYKTRNYLFGLRFDDKKWNLNEGKSKSFFQQKYIFEQRTFSWKRIDGTDVSPSYIFKFVFWVHVNVIFLKISLKSGLLPETLFSFEFRTFSPCKIIFFIRKLFGNF